MPEFRSAMVCCGNITVSSSFVSMSKTVIERTFKLATVQRVSIKPGKVTRSKTILINFLKPMVKAQPIATFLLTNLGCHLTQHKANIVEWTLHPKGSLFTRESLPNHV